MIDRMSCGLMPAKPHTVLRDAEGNLLYEEMLTRGGFSGAFSYLYHRYPTTAALEVTVSKRGHAVPVADQLPNSMTAVCHTMQPTVVHVALRNVGTIRDFSHDPDRLLTD